MEQHNQAPGGLNVTRLPEHQLLELIRTSLAVSGRFVLTVTGNSMAPTLHHLRDQVELLPPEVRPPKPGEIVLFHRSCGGCILHRILRRKKGLFLINGDAQGWTEQIRPDQVIAVVGRFCRSGKWISCDAPRYRVYQTLWQMLYPWRAFISRRRAARKSPSK